MIFSNYFHLLFLTLSMENKGNIASKARLKFSISSTMLVECAGHGRLWFALDGTRSGSGSETLSSGVLYYNFMDEATGPAVIPRQKLVSLSMFGSSYTPSSFRKYTIRTILGSCS
jgi:hypothetical protein